MLTQIKLPREPEITSLVEYLKLKRRLEGVSKTLVKQAEDLVAKLYKEEGGLPFTSLLWDRAIAAAVKYESEK